MFEFIALLFILAIVVRIVIMISQKISRSNKAKELGAVEKIPVGKYLVGLPDTDTPKDNVECVITKKELVFLIGGGIEIGKIPRNAINQITFDDKSQISQRLTITRMVTLGIFSLATPKKSKHKEFCLLIDWDDTNGTRWNTIFEFSGPGSELFSTKGMNKLNKYIKPKATVLKLNEKKCPYCAEIIKKEAKICRFCGKKLSSRLTSHST